MKTNKIKMMKEKLNDFSLKMYFKFREEDGVGTVELVLILAALIALLLVFKEQLTEFIKTFIKDVGTKSQDLFL